MEIIKKEYTNPRPILYLYKGVPETSLVSNDFDTATGITLTTKTNEVSTLSFSIPFTKNRKISHDDCEKLVKFSGEYYIIKTIETEDEETGNIQVSCVSESTELKGVYCKYIDLIGASPNEMFDKIMSSTMHPIDTGYKWAGTDVDPTKKRHLQTEEEASVYQNLIGIAEVFNGWLEFYTDENEQNWIYLRTNPINNGKFIRKNIDLKSLNITYSSEEIFTRLYPLGAVDTLTGEELNILNVNPTGKSYIENYSYYLAKGIPSNIIDKQAKYQQLKTMRADDYTDANELLQYANEELLKCCVPQLDAELTIQDLSIYIDSLEEPPMVGYEITCIDKDIDFILGCQITEVERNYDNPLETKISISNVISYNTVFQNIQHSADSADQITKNDGDGGTYVPIGKVCDGDHVNVQMKLDNQQSIIVQQANKIALVVEDVDKSKAELVVQADKIQSIVTDVSGVHSSITQQADKIQSVVEDVDKNTSAISQQADQISLKVSRGSQFTSEMKQNASAFQFLFNDASNGKTEIDSNGIGVYSGGFTIYNNSSSKLMWIGSDGKIYIKDDKSLILGNKRLYDYMLLSSIGIDTSLDMNNYNITNFKKINGLRADFSNCEVSGDLWVDDTITCESLSVEGGSKNCLINTINYGGRLINAYETAEYYFGDIGEGTIGEDGFIYIYFDPIFLECVNTKNSYHVFTQVYNDKSNITNIERFENYCIIHGDVGTEFSWELKAKRIGFENHRLEVRNVTLPKNTIIDVEDI